MKIRVPLKPRKKDKTGQVENGIGVGSRAKYRTYVKRNK